MNKLSLELSRFNHSGHPQDVLSPVDVQACGTLEKCHEH